MRSSLRILLLTAALAAPAALACEGICDNSFLLEEGYNQDPGMVQSVQTFSFQPGIDAWDYSFSQEWPAWERKHQLSYTVPAGRANGEGGVGDIQITYRHNLLHWDDDVFILSARATLVLPTGNAARGLGAGSFGVQTAAAVSVLPLKWLQFNTNLAMSFPFDAAPAAGGSFTFGQSVVWKAHNHFNALVEAIYVHPVTPQGDGGTVAPDLFISPGVRFSIDLPFGIQVVPGVAVPIGVGPSAGSWNLFFYLSVENPFVLDEKKDDEKKPDELKPEAPRPGAVEQPAS